MIPYGKQFIDEDDISSVLEVLRSDWLTTGPKVAEFERAFAAYVGVQDAVAVSSGTAALHCAMYALDIGPSDEVIVPPITFVATANCVIFQGGTPIFADVNADTLLIDPCQIEQRISKKTKALIAVDYAGQPCDYDELRKICDRHDLALVADGCHALGAEYKSRKVGSLADMTVFSFHPVKHITTGEGGMIATNKAHLAQRMRIFRNHGIATDYREREKQGSWYYEIGDLGYNYRMTDIQCALGISQLKKINDFLACRRKIASLYHQGFSDLPKVAPLITTHHVSHAYHLYVVRIDFQSMNYSRATFFKDMFKLGVGVNVHYIPVHLHPFYRDRFHTYPGQSPVAEAVYEKIVSLPIYPKMTTTEVEVVIESLKQTLKGT